MKNNQSIFKYFVMGKKTAYLNCPSKNMFSKTAYAMINEIIYDEMVLSNALKDFAYAAMRQFASNNMDERKCILMMPDYVIEIIRHEMRRAYLVENNILFEDGSQFMGMTVRTGYEDKFICFHKDYPFKKQAFMYCEESLPMPMKWVDS